jgi:hypothetical protein
VYGTRVRYELDHFEEKLAKNPEIIHILSTRSDPDPVNYSGCNLIRIHNNEQDGHRK